VLFFTRPRKFGKSLFLMMMTCYYDCCKADIFDLLFGDLYIGKHPTPNKSNYIVFNLDFSGLNTNSEQEFKESFNRKMKSSVLSFFREHPTVPNASDIAHKLLNSNGDIGLEALDYVFQTAENCGKKVYIIIDEYDHFANDIIAQADDLSGTEYYHKMVGANSIVRDFYEMLKEYSKTIIDRIFITGITPIMLDDMTSGFNISNNISIKGKYNEILGFTKEDVQFLMREAGIDPAWIKLDMETFYNGYLFHEKGGNTVYNPSMTLYFLNEVVDLKDEYEHIIDENLKMDYGRLARLFEDEQNRAQLLEIATNGYISGGEIVAKFSLDELRERQKFLSLLFYFGLVTIGKKDNRPILRIPNYSIKNIYWEYIEKLTLARNKKISIDVSKLSEALYLLAYEGKAKQFIEYIRRTFICDLSNRDFMQFDEKYLKIILFLNLKYANYFVPLSEYEVGAGYCDIYLMRSAPHADLPCEWVWEIKYIRQKDADNPEVIEKKCEQARKQLAKYRNSAFFRNRKDVRFLSAVFIGKKKVEIEEI